jgi:molybdenum-dependent DNA-binding transcriptional regulator ModE
MSDSTLTKRGRPSTLTDEQADNLKAAVEEGKSIKAAAEAAGVKYHVARHYIVKVLGVEVKRGRKGGVVTIETTEETETTETTTDEVESEETIEA